MDRAWFARLNLLVAAGRTRREALLLLLAGGLGALGSGEVASAWKHRRRHRKRRRRGGRGPNGGNACDVCPSGCQFSSIQAAIDAAEEDEVKQQFSVCPGTYKVRSDSPLVHPLPAV